jgi:hypothetical protein
MSGIPMGKLPVQHPETPRQAAGAKVWRTDLLFAVGLCDYSAGTVTAKSRRKQGQDPKRPNLKERWH